ncbi:MAG: hypothetical protein F2793_09935, partial [Actinobacteria bacterium]|nr:hypothetical protein [Actinomycetota bacterium]
SRPRIVVLSDGEDTASTRSLASVAAEAKSAGVPIDVVALQPTADQLTALKALAGASGGTLQTATASADLLKAFLEASRTFGAKAYLTATLPDGVDGQAQQVTATLDVAGLEFEQQAKLPDNASLAATSVGDTSPASSSSDPSSQGAAGGGSSRLPMLLGLLVFACILILGAVFVRSQSAVRAGDRVNQVLRYRSASHPSSVAKDAASSRVQGLNDVLARSKRYRKTEQLLAAAAVDLTSGGWLLVRVTVTVLLIVIIGVFLGSLVFGVVLGGLLGWLGTMAWMNSRKAARQRMFADDLPDFLMLLASGLRAGLSFNHALESAASEGKGEVGRQMRRTLRQVQVGMALDTALMGCADRMDNDDLRWTVTALSIQQEVGGNLSTILDAAARTIRARHELRREVRTLSAEGRLSAYILVGLPIVVFCFLAIFRPEYISKLWLDPLGILMLSGLIIAMFAGWMWMRSVVRINV